MQTAHRHSQSVGSSTVHGRKRLWQHASGFLLTPFGLSVRGHPSTVEMSLTVWGLASKILTNQSATCRPAGLCRGQHANNDWQQNLKPSQTSPLQLNLRCWLSSHSQDLAARCSRPVAVPAQPFRGSPLSHGASRFPAAQACNPNQACISQAHLIICTSAPCIAHSSVSLFLLSGCPPSQPPGPASQPTMAVEHPCISLEQQNQGHP